MPANCKSVKICAQPSAVDSSDLQSNRRVSRYRVTLNSPSATGAETALNGNDGSATVPAYGAAWGATSLALLDKSAELVSQDETRLLYDVTCTYRNPTASGSDVSEEPWDRPFLFEYGEVRYTTDMLTDSAGTKIVNKAGDLFDSVPRVEKTNTLITVRFAKKVADFTYATVAALRGTLNAASFTINGTAYDAKKVRFLSVTAAQSTYIAPGTSTETTYYNIVLQFEVAVDWPLDPLTIANVGFRKLVSGVPRNIKQKIVLSDGSTPPDPLTGKDAEEDIRRPVFLNASGGVWVTGDPAGDKYIDFHPFASADWSVLVSL